MRLLVRRVGTALFPILHHAATAVPSSLLPGTILLDLTTSKRVRSSDIRAKAQVPRSARGYYPDMRALVICAFQPSHVCWQMDEDIVRKVEMATQLGFLV